LSEAIKSHPSGTTFGDRIVWLRPRSSPFAALWVDLLGRFSRSPQVPPFAHLMLMLMLMLMLILPAESGANIY